MKLGLRVILLQLLGRLILLPIYLIALPFMVLVFLLGFAYDVANYPENYKKK